MSLNQSGLRMSDGSLVPTGLGAGLLGVDLDGLTVANHYLA
jgi:hypothetical protein